MDLDDALGILGLHVLITRHGEFFDVECNLCSNGDYLWSEDRKTDFTLGNEVLARAWKHVAEQHRKELDDVVVGVSESEEKEAIASIAKAYVKEAP